MQYLLLRGLSYRLAHQVLGPRIFVDGLDELSSIQSDGGVVLVSNHRTFFDQFAILLAMVHRGVAWTNTFSFPVRSKFFYDSPLGTLVNLGLGGGAMYPPIFRDAARAAQNDEALSYLIDALKQPGHLVGIHPEGTRNRNPDPYALLPAQPGVGKIALQSGVTVIPVFTSGLSNDLFGALRASRASDARRRAPIIIVFGKPIGYEDLRAKPPRLVLYKKAADRFMAEVAALMPREQALRTAITAGEIADDDPAWLTNHPIPFGAAELWAHSKATGRVA